MILAIYVITIAWQSNKIPANPNQNGSIIIGQTLEEQHQDYQKHIAVLKESLCAKEEHYTMLQTDVSLTFLLQDHEGGGGIRP